jgi:hypothetical protein
VCYLSLQQDLYHASRIYTGLCDLSNQGTAQIKFVVSRGEQNFCAESPHTICMQVRLCKSGESRLLAIDLSDHSDILTMGTLKSCDAYLKRSYYESDLTGLPDELRGKVIPFGLNYACRSFASTLPILTALVPRFVWRFGRLPWPSLRAIQSHIGVLQQFLTSPGPRTFEHDPGQSVEPTILFQTRVWSPEEVSENADEINAERVALVRALQKAFGSQFQGGLVPTSYARRHYPAEISKHSSRHSEYVTWGKKKLIGINTRGLHHSLAFKLPEYLAASKCVVSCPLRNELPVPLVDRQHYLAFKTPEECVEHCDHLLRDSKLAAKLRKEAWEYYQREVEPAAHLRSCLIRIAQLGEK